ncbi:hypothetical protein M9H77_31676 [Catharanthus roseus]|uniref:Uncharacterized protein n=1 Tax=Catharanthus roseus TaxID=4058 RepID=A0ACC0A142_CATRO|nr:hypothetical protein M9H77_31676 [Catharanthus roseus]
MKSQEKMDETMMLMGGIVSDYWGSVGDENDRKIAQNLKGLAIELKELGRKKYSDLSCKINHLERELQRLMEEQIRGREMKSLTMFMENQILIHHNGGTSGSPHSNFEPIKKQLLDNVARIKLSYHDLELLHDNIFFGHIVDTFSSTCASTGSKIHIFLGFFVESGYFERVHWFPCSLSGFFHANLKGKFIENCDYVLSFLYASMKNFNGFIPSIQFLCLVIPSNVTLILQIFERQYLRTNPFKRGENQDMRKSLEDVYKPTKLLMIHVLRKEQLMKQVGGTNIEVLGKIGLAVDSRPYNYRPQ